MVTEKLKEIDSLLLELKDDAVKFEKGQLAAVKRIRKNSKTISSILREVGKFVQESKNKLKEERKASKKEKAAA